MLRTWDEIQALAAELSALYPDVDPREIPLKKLRDSLLDLPDLHRPMEGMTPGLLEAMRQAWLEGAQDEDEEEEAPGEP